MWGLSPGNARKEEAVSGFREVENLALRWPIDYGVTNVLDVDGDVLVVVDVGRLVAAKIVDVHDIWFAFLSQA